MKTMCPSGYHHNGFVETLALGHIMYGLHDAHDCISTYIYIFFFFIFFFLENTPYLEDPSFLLKKSPSLFWLFYKRKV